MNGVKIRNLVVGEGMPKICVPVVGTDRAEILESVERICSLAAPPDIIEFRADWYRHIFAPGSLRELLEGLRKRIGDIPLLFTFRTAVEGGEKPASLAEYQKLLLCAAGSGWVDAVDVEAFSFGVSMAGLVEQLHGEGMVVIGSSHDFAGTPDSAELLKRLYQMRDCRMDIAKLAVMPENIGDVHRLLGVTWQASSDADMCPVITMSMAGQGVVSRLTGEVFGSAVTFASAGRASAPGQIEIGKLRQVLEIIHEGSSCAAKDVAE